MPDATAVLALHEIPAPLRRPMNPVVAQQRAAVDQFCRRYHVRRLELFGSAAVDRDRADQSDFDFLLEFEPLPAGAYADTYFGLLEALEALFDRPVELIVASAIKTPTSARQSMRPGRSSFAA